MHFCQQNISKEKQQKNAKSYTNIICCRSMPPGFIENRQQSLPLVNSIAIWPAGMSRLAGRTLKQKIASARAN